jgi:hypothetical protein
MAIQSEYPMADGASTERQTIQSSHYQLLWQHSTLSFRQLYIGLNGKLNTNYLVLYSTKGSMGNGVFT